MSTTTIPDLRSYLDVLKKEALLLERERIKLDKYMRGMKDMDKLPGAIFIVDVKKEAIAVKEAYSRASAETQDK